MFYKSTWIFLGYKKFCHQLQIEWKLIWADRNMCNNKKNKNNQE